jgi:ketosteroid isomerase-like protein
VQPAIRLGDLALTSTRFDIITTGGQTTTVRTATVEIARRQPDGTWLWAVDQPNVLAP